MTKIDIEIPSYLKLKDYKCLNSLQFMETVEDKIKIISSITNVPQTDILKWTIPSVIQVYNEILNIIKDIKGEFYPLIEWNNQVYGYSNLSKMSLAEIIDLENLVKDQDKNIEDIIAILYRPVIENKLGATFITKSTYKALKYQQENVFDYYKLEEYSSDNRKQVKSQYNEFPLEIALGALSFFLGTVTLLSKDSQIYSQFPTIQKLMINKKRKRLANITDGYIRSMNLVTLPSYR